MRRSFRWPAPTLISWMLALPSCGSGTPTLTTQAADGASTEVTPTSDATPTPDAPSNAVVDASSDAVSDAVSNATSDAISERTESESAPACPATYLGESPCTTPGQICAYDDDGHGCPGALRCTQVNPSYEGWQVVFPGAGGPCHTVGALCRYDFSTEDFIDLRALACGTAMRWQLHDLCPPSVPMPGARCPTQGMLCSYKCGQDLLAVAQCLDAPDGGLPGWFVSRYTDGGCNDAGND